MKITKTTRERTQYSLFNGMEEEERLEERGRGARERRGERIASSLAP